MGSVIRHAESNKINDLQTLYYNRKKLYSTTPCRKDKTNTKCSVYTVETCLGININRRKEKSLIHPVENYFPT